MHMLCDIHKCVEYNFQTTLRVVNDVKKRYAHRFLGDWTDSTRATRLNYPFLCRTNGPTSTSVCYAISSVVNYYWMFTDQCLAAYIIVYALLICVTYNVSMATVQFLIFSLLLSFLLSLHCCVVTVSALLGMCTNRRCRGNGCFLLLPRIEKLQNHGVV